MASTDALTAHKPSQHHKKGARAEFVGHSKSLQSSLVSIRCTAL